MTKKIDLEKVKANFITLSQIAETLNERSNELAKPIDEIEYTLNDLKLGVQANYDIDKDTRLSYGRIMERDNKQLRGHSSRWGLIIVWKKESWPYNNAPRFLRIKCVDAIPWLIEAIATEADNLTQDLTKQNMVAQGWNKQIKAMIESK